MSKAFTKEPEATVEPMPVRRMLELPEGAKNYLTPAGAARLRAEHDELAREPRPETQERLTELAEHLELAEVVNPATQEHDLVRFGATVRLRNGAAAESTYTIVGIPEADPKQGRISWLSPIARSLLGAHVGDLVTLRTPGGTEEREVVAISYD